MENFKIEIMLAITGCARSGTNYISELFKKSGIDIGHERLGSKGISSWIIANNLKMWGASYKEVIEKYKDIPFMHQIRNPIHQISSMTTTSNWNKICQVLPEINLTDNILLKSMKYWYYWNLSAELRCEFRYKIEDIEEVFQYLCTIGGFKDVKMAEVPKNINKRVHKDFTLTDFYKEDKELTKKILLLAKKYNYYLN